MRTGLTRVEATLLAFVLALLALALALPGLQQPAGFHDFADRRMLMGLPYAMDVLSNLPFGMAGLAGLWLLWRSPAAMPSRAHRDMAVLFFGGLIAVAGGSSWYHLRPDDAALAIDRYAMCIAFAGLLGLAVADRISERAGPALGLSLLVLAPLSVLAWSATGNVVPWACVQFGGMSMLLMLALLPVRAGAPGVRWMLVLGAYGSAKVFEVNDHAVYALTGGWLSGHSMKHIAAAAAALPVMAAVIAAGAQRQNAADRRASPGASHPAQHA